MIVGNYAGGIVTSHSREGRDFIGIIYFTLGFSFAAFTKMTGHKYFTPEL